MKHRVGFAMQSLVRLCTRLPFGRVCHSSRRAGSAICYLLPGAGKTLIARKRKTRRKPFHPHPEVNREPKRHVARKRIPGLCVAGQGEMATTTVFCTVTQIGDVFVEQIVEHLLQMQSNALNSVHFPLANLLKARRTGVCRGL
jgi:hypothetical protein